MGSLVKCCCLYDGRILLANSTPVGAADGGELLGHSETYL